MEKRKRTFRQAVSNFLNPAKASMLLHDDLKVQRKRLLLLKSEYSNLAKWKEEYVKTLTLLTDAMDALVWKKDIDHRYILANPLHCETFFNYHDEHDCLQTIVGRTDCELIKMNFEDLGIENTFSRNCVDSDNYVRKTGETVHFLEAGMVGGKELLLYAIKAPQYSKKGKFIGTLGIGWNVTGKSDFLIEQLNRWIYAKVAKEIYHEDSSFCYVLTSDVNRCEIFNHICPDPKRSYNNCKCRL